MDTVTKEVLISLIGEEKSPCVSVFLPTHRVGREVKQDPIRYKNLLGKAEKLLTDKVPHQADLRRMLDKAGELLMDSLFWQHQGDGLAVFVSPQSFFRYRLPRRLEETVYVGERFYLKPLLPLLNDDLRFYILSMTLNRPRLYGATAYTMEAVDLGDVPGSLAEALKYDQYEKQVQYHTAGRKGSRPVFHGHGTGIDDYKAGIQQYFRGVDKGLIRVLTDQRAPLVFAGVDYLLPLYREVNTYPFLDSQGVPGNPENMKEEELHSRALAIVQPLLREEQNRAAGLYQQLVTAGNDRATDDLDRIERDAFRGRVETLFLDAGYRDSDVIYPGAGQKPGEAKSRCELLDLASRYTLLNGGTVYAVDKGGVPSGSEAAAILRY